MLPLNLGIRAHDLTYSGLPSLIQQIKKYNFTHIQFSIAKCFPETLNDYTQITPGLARYYRNAFAANQIQISVMGCYVNMAASDEAVRQMAINRFKHETALINDFDAVVIGSETGSIGNGYTTDNFTELAYQRVRDTVSLLVENAEKLGVTVAIEAGLHHPIYTSALAKRLLHEIGSPNLKIILDVANLARPDNYQNMDQVIQLALDDLNDSIEMIHLKDFTVNHGKLDIVPVGQGVMDYTEILKYIKYQRPMMYVSLEATKEPFIRPAIDLIEKSYQQL